MNGSCAAVAPPSTESSKRHGEETRTAEADYLEQLQDRRQPVRLGTIEAPDEATAMEKAAEEFKVPASRLLVVRR
jgi:hypothetical protein